MEVNPAPLSLVLRQSKRLAPRRSPQGGVSPVPLPIDCSVVTMYTRGRFWGVKDSVLVKDDEEGFSHY